MVGEEERAREKEWKIKIKMKEFRRSRKKKKVQAPAGVVVSALCSVLLLYKLSGPSLLFRRPCDLGELGPSPKMWGKKKKVRTYVRPRHVLPITGSQVSSPRPRSVSNMGGAGAGLGSHGPL